VIADAPVDRIPLWARAGAVLPKIPEDVMTLVPSSESGNTSIKSLDNRRVYEIVGGSAESPDTTVTDFEGRTIARRAHSLKIDGPAARVTVRWRFGNIGRATVNGTPATLQANADGPSIDFDHGSSSLVEWQEGTPPAPIAAPAPTPAPTAAAPTRGRKTVRGATKAPAPAPAPITTTTPEAAPATTEPAAPTAKPATPTAKPAAKPATTKKKTTTHHHRRFRRKKK